MAGIDLVGLAEIAETHGVAYNTAWRWTKRDDFPDPARKFGSSPVWRRRDVEAWAKKTLPLPRTGRPPKTPPAN